jgi:hypothetical protein
MLQNNAADTHDMRPLSARARRGKTRLRTLDRLDGRTVAAKRARQLIALWTTALRHTPSPVEVMAITHAAACCAISEDAQARRLAGDTSITPEQITKLSNIATRAVNALNLPTEREPERNGKHVTLADLPPVRSA